MKGPFKDRGHRELAVVHRRLQLHCCRFIAQNSAAPYRALS